MKEEEKTWCPAIEFNETEKYLILKAEIPGVEIKNLNISANPDSVSAHSNALFCPRILRPTRGSP